MHPNTPSATPRSRRYVAAVVIFATAGFAIWLAVDQRREAALELIAPRGRLLVEVARTPEARASGLANRVHVTHDGLLLLWDAPGRHPIWMAEMRFALDIAWLDEHGRVLAVITDAPPCAASPCPLYEPPGSERSTSVLELPAGEAGRHGIEVGSIIQTPPRR